MVSASTVLASASLSAITPSKSKINAPKLKPHSKTRIRPAIGHQAAFHPWAGAAIAEQILFHVVSAGGTASASSIPRHQPAIDRNHRPGQVRGRRQAQAQRHMRDLFRIAVAAERGAALGVDRLV